MATEVGLPGLAGAEFALLDLESTDDCFSGMFVRIQSTRT